MGKEGGREIVTPRRWVQRQGNERLPALHHAQGLPQSAGGRGKMPHVSALLAPLLLCVHLGLCVSQDGEEAGNQEFRYRILHPPPPSQIHAILPKVQDISLLFFCFYFLVQARNGGAMRQPASPRCLSPHPAKHDSPSPRFRLG